MTHVTAERVPSVTFKIKNARFCRHFLHMIAHETHESLATFRLIKVYKHPINLGWFFIVWPDSKIFFTTAARSHAR